MILVDTNDIVRIISSTTGDIEVSADWVDWTTGPAVTPGSTITLITTATTTTVVASPAASTQRQVKSLVVANRHASTSMGVTVEKFDNTNAANVWQGTLLAGESVVYDGARWHPYDATGIPKTAYINTDPTWKRSILINDHSISSATATEVSEMSIALTPGTWNFKYNLILQSATTTVGLLLGVNYTGTATRFMAWLKWPDVGVLAATGQMDDASAIATGAIVAYSNTRTESTTAPNMNTGTAGVITVDQDHFVILDGIIVVSDTGDLELWHGSETATATRVEAGSTLEVIKFG